MKIRKARYVLLLLLLLLLLLTCFILDLAVSLDAAVWLLYLAPVGLPRG
jgi:uncharacterized membrane protein